MKLFSNLRGERTLPRSQGPGSIYLYFPVSSSPSSQRPRPLCPAYRDPELSTVTSNTDLPQATVFILQPLAHQAWECGMKSSVLETRDLRRASCDPGSGMRASETAGAQKGEVTCRSPAGKEKGLDLGLLPVGAGWDNCSHKVPLQTDPSAWPHASYTAQEGHRSAATRATHTVVQPTSSHSPVAAAVTEASSDR